MTQYGACECLKQVNKIIFNAINMLNTKYMYKQPKADKGKEVIFESL